MRLAVIDGRGPIKDATVAVVSEIPSNFAGLNVGNYWGVKGISHGIHCDLF